MKPTQDERFKRKHHKRLSIYKRSSFEQQIELNIEWTEFKMAQMRLGSNRMKTTANTISSGKSPLLPSLSVPTPFFATL